MSQPSVFVGSSGEGLRVAREIQSQLADVGEVERWDEGVFALGSGTLESLVQALNRFDFAVFVLTPDELIVSRGAQQNSARDNVLIELGLFIGRLGRERTFLVCCKDDKIKIPSDLAGITFATYSKRSNDSKLTPAVGPACTKIRNAIEAQGKAAELQKLKNEVKQQELDIEAIRVALRGIVTKYEHEYLRRLTDPQPFPSEVEDGEYHYENNKHHYTPDVYPRLKRLDDIGFIRPTEIDGHRRLLRINDDHAGDESLRNEDRPRFKLREYVEITDAGRNYLALAGLK